MKKGFINKDGKKKEKSTSQDTAKTLKKDFQPKDMKNIKNMMKY